AEGRDRRAHPDAAQETERGTAGEQLKAAMKWHSEGELDEKHTYHDHDPHHRDERRVLGDHDLRRARRQHQQLFDGSAFAFTNHSRFGDERCIEEQSQPEYSGYQKPGALQAGVVKKGRLQCDESTPTTCVPRPECIATPAPAQICSARPNDRFGITLADGSVVRAYPGQETL